MPSGADLQALRVTAATTRSAQRDLYAAVTGMCADMHQRLPEWASDAHTRQAYRSGCAHLEQELPAMLRIVDAIDRAIVAAELDSSAPPGVGGPDVGALG